MNYQWYCSIASQQYGPLPFEQLQQWAAEGRLRPDDHVCIVGQQQWTAARDVPNLFAADLFASAPSPEQAFFAPPTSSSSTSSRRSSVPKKKGSSFNTTGAIIAGLLATIGCISQVTRMLANNERAHQQRLQERQARERMYRVPAPPPITAPRIYTDTNPKVKQPWQK